MPIMSFNVHCLEQTAGVSRWRSKIKSTIENNKVILNLIRTHYNYQICNKIDRSDALIYCVYQL